MRLRRRITLQLTPLLDMLLTVIFLQYLAVREREEATNQSAAQVRAEAAMLESERTALIDQTRRLEQSQRDAERRLEQATDRQQEMGRLLASMFHLDVKELEAILDQAASSPVADSAEERTRLRDEIRRLGKATPGEMVQHLLTYEELRKRCDIWELFIGADGVAVLDTGDRTPRFRVNLADDQTAEIERFREEFVKVFRTLPEPKSLVVIVLTYDRAARLAVTESVSAELPRIVDALRQASGGTTRFESADLGIKLR
jgi:hypothetical protein